MTTSPQDQSRLTAVLDELTNALKTHLAACVRSTGEADHAVQSAYTALRTAAERYDDLLFTVLDEVTPWEFAEAPSLDVEYVDPDAVPDVVGVLVRRDYSVADDGALLAAGRDAYAEQHAVDSGEAATADINTAGRALYQILDAHGIGGLDRRAEAAGLRPRGGTVWVQALDAEDAATLVDDPFGVADEDMLIYRQDDVATPDDSGIDPGRSG